MKDLARRWLSVFIACVLTVVVTALAPRQLRKLATFRVLNVEVAGAELVTADRVVEIAGITEASSVFDDMRPWRDSLLADPMIAQVRIVRRAPSTIRITIRETDPVAYASVPELVPVDARGHALSIADGIGLDVPVMTARGQLDENGALTDSASLTLLGALEQVRVHEPWLLDWVSSLDLDEAGDVVMTLRWPDARILLPAHIDPALLADVRLVIADLASQPVSDRAALSIGTPIDISDSELGGLVRLDARFNDQVVVSLEPGRAATRSAEAN